MGSFPETSNGPLSFLTLCKVAVQDSFGFSNPHCGFLFPGTGFCIPFHWNLASYFQSLTGFKIP